MAVKPRQRVELRIPYRLKLILQKEAERRGVSLNQHVTYCLDHRRAGTRRWQKGNEDVRRPD
jgi:predicted HicB family RNase H-like nuclease